MTSAPRLHRHLDDALDAVASLRAGLEALDRWGDELAERLSGGARLLAAGNGGSAAHAQHLTAELVGRFCDIRVPLSALALHADTSAYTALANDFGHDAVLARQVVAHGRRGDVLVAFSTSGRSPNLVAAAEVATALGLRVLAFTGPAPNPLAAAAHGAVCVPAPTTAAVQEAHQVALHLLCAALEARLALPPAPSTAVAGARGTR